MKRRFALAALPVLLVLSLVQAACGAGGSSATPDATADISPAASDAPAAPSLTPTPIAVDVKGPAAAAALVIATDPRFEGATELSPDMIGASRYWQATALDGGAYQIVMTLGWGDCMAGCIEQHTWTYRVTADGEVTLLEESGDPVPDGSFPTG